MNVTDNAPKVFVSHAGEDKPFVIEFAKRLRENGVDAWVDQWEILPGDKLINKIFEQGIGQCQAFIIVLSLNSVAKPWVSEELDAALVQRIQQQTKIIPIKIDDCVVPVALRATAYLNVNTSTSYDAEFQRILASIFGTEIKPSIGERPAVFANEQLVAGYDVVETHILEFLLKQYVDNPLGYIDAAQLQEAFSGLSPQVISNAIELFEVDGIIKAHDAHGTAPFSFSFLELSELGWHRHARQFVGIDPETDEKQVLALVASENEVSALYISERLQMTPARVNMSADYLHNLGYVKCRRAMGSAPYTFVSIESTALGRKVSRSEHR